MTVVLAVDGTKILGQPSETPAGKMAIDLSTVCDYNHQAAVPDVPANDPNSGYYNPDFPNLTPPSDGGSYDDQIPGEDTWVGGETFGIQ